METKAPDDRPTAQDVWMRGLFMLLFIIGFAVGQWLLNILAVVQLVWLLFVREPNHFIAGFGNSLSIWLAEVGRFLTATTEDKPFPWQPPPNAGARPPRITPSSLIISLGTTKKGSAHAAQDPQSASERLRLHGVFRGRGGILPSIHPRSGYPESMALLP